MRDTASPDAKSLRRGVPRGESFIPLFNNRNICPTVSHDSAIKCVSKEIDNDGMVFP